MEDMGSGTPEETPEPKGAGQGKGKWTKKGVQADQEARIAATEAGLEAHTADGHGGEQTEVPS